MHTLATKRLGLTFIAVLAVLAITTAFTVTSASAKAGDRPFKGIMVNNDTAGLPYPAVDPVTGAPQLRIDVEISGEVRATHIGKGSVEGSVTIDFLPFILGGCSELVDGTIDFTAANGDEINMDMTVNSLCSTTGVFTGHYSIQGGTGRFDSASGEIDVSSVPVPGEPSVNTLTGTIVY